MQGTLLEQLVGADVGECHLERLLSYGPLGAVYRAHRRLPNRPVMLTLLLFPEDMAARARQQFRDW